MTRTLYYILIFLSVLGIITGMAQGIILLIIGRQMFALTSIQVWLLWLFLIPASASVLVLKYYYEKQYRAALIAGAAHSAATLFQSVVIYVMLFYNSSVQGVYMPSYVIVMFTGMIYSVVLFLSKTRQRYWLRSLGVMTAIFGVVFSITIVGGFWVKDVEVRNNLQEAGQWAMLLSSCIPALFLINFLDEIKNLPKRGETKHMDVVVSVFSVSLLITLFLVFKISYEGSDALYWQRKNVENTEAFVRRCEVFTHIDDHHDTLKYALMRPLHYNVHEKYPLVVCLPYGGYEAPPAQWLAGDGIRDKYQAFLFTPFCPQGAGWGGVRNYPTIDTLVFDAISNLIKEGGIDEKRIYVTGVSRGGYGAWHFITARPDLFAAAIPVCGAGDPDLASKITNVSVWAFHSANDRNVPVEGSRVMIEAMKKAGANPLYTEYPNEAHNIWHRVSNTQGLLDWLFEQKHE